MTGVIFGRANARYVTVAFRTGDNCATAMFAFADHGSGAVEMASPQFPYPFSRHSWSPSFSRFLGFRFPSGEPA
jgi:hypothetical protein